MGALTFRSAGEIVSKTGLYGLLCNVRVPGRARPQTVCLVTYDVCEPVHIAEAVDSFLDAALASLRFQVFGNGVCRQEGF